jgi:hypothetical protein
LKLRVGYELQYEFLQPTPLVAMLNVHFSRVCRSGAAGSNSHHPLDSDADEP